MNQDRLSQQEALVHTAHLGDREKGPLDLGNHQPDLVHVRGQHQLAARFRAAALLERDQVAQGIGLDLVHQRGPQIDDLIPDAVLKAG